MDYWKECVAEALEDAGITASDEQIDTVASWVEGAHDNYGMAFGHDCIPNPVTLENERLKKEIKKERDKIICPECKGTGEYITRGPIHSAWSQCGKCRGEGRCAR